MVKQLSTEVAAQMMADGAIARFIKCPDGHTRWVVGLKQLPCGTAIKHLASRAMLWMACGDEERVHAGLNSRGKRYWIEGGYVD